MSDLISRQAAIERLTDIRICLDDESQQFMDLLIREISDLPSAEPQPSELARDIATIIENEMDMRVILKNADAEPCDFCANRDDCEDMRIYCPARPVERQTERSE